MAPSVYLFYILLVKMLSILKKVLSKGIKNIETRICVNLNRWRPVLGVEQILVSVLSMLNAPNIDSPANVDAGVRNVFVRVFI